MDVFSEIAACRRDGRTAVLVTVVASRGHVPTEVGTRMLVTADGRAAGTVGGGALEHRAIADAREVLADGRSRLRDYDLGDTGDATATSVPMICGGRVSLFFDVIGPAARAYLLGAGHVGRALHDVLAPLDFAVTFVDCRPEQLADLPAPHLVAGPDYATLPPLPGLADAYVVIATHSHVADERALAQLLAAAPPRPRYLGVVASRRKRDEMFANLRARLGADVDLADIFMPIGLHLGGNSPAAVALSIAAEIQAHRHGITGHAHMRDRGQAPG